MFLALMKAARRRGAPAAAAGLVATGAALSPATPAATASPALSLDGVSCSNVKTHVTYKPGLTDTPQIVTISVDETFGGCTALLHPKITSAHYKGSFTPEELRSCNNLLLARPGHSTLTWNTGQTSTLKFETTSAYIDGKLVGTQIGSVTEGLFAGDIYNATATATVAELVELEKCSTPEGLTTQEAFGVTNLIPLVL